MAAATIADLLLPIFSGRLVDAIASPGTSRLHAFHNGEIAVAAMVGLGAVLIAARYLAIMGVTRLTLRLMSRIASDAFWRIQRLPTDWHANNFAGSIVRRITRGMWAVDLMDDTLLLALFPALLVLAGSSLVLGLRWWSMGLLVAVAATFYVAISIALSVGWVAPAARLSNAQDTRIGAALADSVTCNAVVKSFGGEAREDARLALFSRNGERAPSAPGPSVRAAARCSTSCYSRYARWSHSMFCCYGGAAQQRPAM